MEEKKGNSGGNCSVGVCGEMGKKLEGFCG